MAWIAKVSAMGIRQKNRARGVQHIKCIADFLQSSLEIRKRQCSEEAKAPWMICRNLRGELIHSSGPGPGLGIFAAARPQMDAWCGHRKNAGGNLMAIRKINGGVS